MTENTPIRQLNNIVTEVAESVVNGKDFTRRRKLPADVLIKTVLNMQGNSLNKELYDAFDYENRMTASAFVMARKKLPEDVFENIFNSYNKTASNLKTLKGYRTYAIDGTDFHTPYNQDSEFVVPNTNGKPYCLAHGNIMMDLLNQTYEDCIIASTRNLDERTAAVTMMERLDHTHKSIVIMDRGYNGFNMIEHCNRTPNLKFVFRDRVTSGTIKEILELPAEECDRDVSVTVTTKTKIANANPSYRKINTLPKKAHTPKYSKATRYSKWEFEDVVTINFRVCKFRINDPDTGKEEWEVLVTNLDRKEFSLSEMKDLYHMRWGIETSFRLLKYDLGAVQFHSKKDNFIRQEIFAHLTMFNVVSRNRMAIEIKKENTKYEYAIDFKMATVITRRYYKDENESNNILGEMLDYLVPIRKDRKYKRTMMPKSVIYFTYRVAA